MNKRLLCVTAALLCLLGLSGCSAEFALSMEHAGLNTLLGMGTVFVVLIFISFVIALIGFVPKMMNKKNQPAKEAPKAPAAPVQKPAPVAPVVEEELADDLELVAVITAAVAAFMEEEGMEVPADGLVVRSIKKRNVKNWKNA